MDTKPPGRGISAGLPMGLRACAGLAASAVLVSLASPAAAFQIVRLTPQGEVSQARQIVARFDEAAVKFGDARAPAPLDVRCTDGAATGGTGRWNHEKEWVLANCIPVFVGEPLWDTKPPPAPEVQDLLDLKQHVAKRRLLPCPTCGQRLPAAS